MIRLGYAGEVIKLIEAKIRDASSTFGGGLTGLVGTTSGWIFAYRLAPSGAWTSLTLSASAGTIGISTSPVGSVVEESATLCPGIYQLAISATTLTVGSWLEWNSKGVTNMVDTAGVAVYCPYSGNTYMGVNALQIGGVNCSAPANFGALVISAAGLLTIGQNGTGGTFAGFSGPFSVVANGGTLNITPTAAAIGTLTIGTGTFAFPIGTGASTTNITAGTIATVTNLTNWVQPLTLNGHTLSLTGTTLTIDGIPVTVVNPAGVTTLLTRIAQPFSYDLDGLPLVDVNEVNGSVLAASGLSTLGVERNNSSTGFLNVNVRMWNGTVTTGMPMPTFTLPGGFTTTTFAATVGTSTYSGGLADTNAAAIKLVTDKLATTLQASGTNWQFTTDALIHGPVGSGLNAQQTRDALDLTATLGGASIDAQLATVLLNAQSANTFANTAAGSGSAANASATQAYNAAQAARLTTDKLATMMTPNGTNYALTAGSFINMPGASIDAQSLANALKLAPAAGSPAAGSVYDGLTTIEAGVAALANIGGRGAYTVLVPFVDTGTLALQGVKAAVTINGVTTPTAPTGTLGIATFNLGLGTYSLAGYLQDYSYGGGVIEVTGSNFTAAHQIMTLEVITTPTLGNSTGVIVLRNYVAGETIEYRAVGVPAGGTGQGFIGDTLTSDPCDSNGRITITLPTGLVPHEARRGDGPWQPFLTPATDSVFYLPDLLSG